MDPWYDYLALPVAPGVLCAQFAALFARRWRVILVGTGTLAIAAMLGVAVGKGEPGDPNIGAGLMTMWLLASLVLLGAAIAMTSRERRWRRPAP